MPQEDGSGIDHVPGAGLPVDAKPAIPGAHYARMFTDGDYVSEDSLGTITRENGRAVLDAGRRAVLEVVIPNPKPPVAGFTRSDNFISVEIGAVTLPDRIAGEDDQTQLIFPPEQPFYLFGYRVADTHHPDAGRPPLPEPVSMVEKLLGGKEAAAAALAAQGITDIATISRASLLVPVRRPATGSPRGGIPAQPSGR